MAAHLSENELTSLTDHLRIIFDDEEKIAEETADYFDTQESLDRVLSDISKHVQTQDEQTTTQNKKFTDFSQKLMAKTEENLSNRALYGCYIVGRFHEEADWRLNPKLVAETDKRIADFLKADK
jgi:hypothetical protein